MGKIKLLDNKTIEKIAAGEVIERPSSIVKELLENSLDAGAKNIAIEIKDGGKSYIRITDDGSGIDETDLDLAFKRHSTSKISSLDDLYKVRSLGFRGEALASISHVSKMEVMTKTVDAIGGIHALVEEGEIVSKETVGTPKGTTMIVKNLFYNLPVRKKFLKSNLVEGNQITDIIYKIALGNLNVSIKFIKDNKIILKTSRNSNMKDHIYSILGKDLSKNIIKIEGETNNFKVEGYISNNKIYRGNRSHQYIYVNNRYIMNNSITNIIEKNYKSIIPLNKFPVFILFIDIDPGIIDVNIHPTKQEINFVNQFELIDKIDQLLNKSLHESITIPEINFRNNKAHSKKEDIPLLYNENNNFEYNDFKKDVLVKDLRYQDNFKYEDKPHEALNFIESYNEEFLVSEKTMDENIKIDIDIEKDHLVNEEEKVDTSNILSNIKPIGVVFNTYILGEDKLNEKIYFIDQHAAHERVMYEKYLREFNNENIVSQQLLAPEIVNLTNLEMNKFLINEKVFKDLGFDVSEFGKNSVAIRSVPLVFGKPDIKSLFYDILDNIDNKILSSYDTKIEKIMKMSCTNAIKSGDKMSEIEILSLFHQLKNTENPNSCPHGRPTILEMSKKDIEKAFLRIL